MVQPYSSTRIKFILAIHAVLLHAVLLLIFTTFTVRVSNFKKKKKNSIKRQKQRAMNYVGTMYPKCPEQIKVQVGSRRPEIRSFACLDEEPAS